MRKQDKYILDLLKNDLFVKWVKNPDNDSENYWSKWLEMNPDKRDEINEARELLKSFRVKDDKKLEAHHYNEMFEKIWEYKHKNGKHEELFYKSKINSGIITWYVAAAVTALVTFFSLSHFLTEKSKAETVSAIAMKVIEVPKGAKRTIKLPDGTLVKMNSGSEISYPSVFDSTKREVKFKGEAFFDVAEDVNAPFTVSSENLKATVLGTTFNFKDFDREDEAVISLVTGKVEVTSLGNKGNTLTLNPGSAAGFEKRSGKFSTHSFDQEAVTAWTEGIILLDSVSIEKMIHILGNWYGVEIKTLNKPTSDRVKVSGRFDNQTLDNVLHSLSYTVMFDYKIDKKEVTIVFENKIP